MLKKSVSSLSKRQRDILSGVWITAHDAFDHRRQSFRVGDDGSICKDCNGKGVSPADPEFKDLIDNGYIERIGDDGFILTESTDGIFDELVAVSIQDRQM